MSFLSRVVDIFRPPADRRIEAAFAAAPQPSTAMVPFGGGAQGPPNTPTIDWNSQGMAPQQGPYVFVPGYSDHTYKPGGAPVGFEGWSLPRVRDAIAAHSIGIFWESSLLMIALLRFAPVLAALQQAIAPIFDLDRYIRGGDKGLAKMVRAELEEALVPRAGLVPSPYLPPTLWGTMMILIRMMGFCVLQHVDGEPDEETGVRPRYTRIWPPWAVRYERTIGKWYAYTQEDAVEIKDDGHFTLVCDTLEPHLNDSAIVAISEEVLSGRLIQQLRNSWFFKYGNPKLVGIMQEKVALNTDQGRAFFAALSTIVGPDGIGAIPYGSDVKFVGLDSKASTSFGAGLQSVILHIAMVMVGGAGTGIDGSESTGEGYYKPQKGGQWSVRHDLIARPFKAIVRGLNGGHIAPYCEGNYGAQIVSTKRSGTWVYPTLDIPLPKPDQEARIAALGGRYKLALEIVKAAHDDGILITQDWLDKLSERLELDPTLVLDSIPGPRILEWHVTMKTVAPDELRETLKLPPMPNGAGSLDRLAEERLSGKDEVGKKASQGDALIDGKPATVPEDAEPAPKPIGDGAPPQQEATP